MLQKAFPNKYDRWLAIYLMVSLVVMTVVPGILNHNLELDVIEGLAWGHEWQLGYWKHPPLAAWLTEMGGMLSPKNGWGTYFICMLSVVGGLIFVYKLFLEMFSKQNAFLATLLTAAGYMYAPRITILNPNTILLFVWPGFLYYFYQSLYKNKIFYWCGLSIFAALSILTKYYSVFLLMSACLYVLLYKEERQIFRNYYAYIAVALFLLLISSHLYWLVQSDFIPFEYATSRLRGKPRLFTYFRSPIKFLIEQLFYIFPAFVLFFYLKRKTKNYQKNRTMLNKKNNKFILFMTLTPLLLFLLIPILTGFKVKGSWGIALWILLGPILLSYLKKDIAGRDIKHILGLSFTFLGVLATIIIMNALAFSERLSRVNFPGKELAQASLSYWSESTQGSPLRYIGGDCWEAGIVAFYADVPERPSVFLDYVTSHSPWIRVDDVKKAGLLMVWIPPKSVCNAPKLPYHFQNVKVSDPKLITLQGHNSKNKIHACFMAVNPR